MAADNWFYNRPELAKQLARLLKDALFSRIAYLGTRRFGKTSFLLKDLAPELIKEGMIPVYVSMWANKSYPHIEMIEQLDATRHELQKEGTIKRILSAEVKKFALGNSLAKVELEFAGAAATQEQLASVRASLAQLIEAAAPRRVVLMLDEFQHLITDDAFDDFQHALRTALDIHDDSLSVIYTGSSRAGMEAAFNDSDLPFYHSAQIKDFPQIDDGFIDHCQSKLKKSYNIDVDKLQLFVFWQEMDYSPYWMIQLIRHLVLEQCTLTAAIKYTKELVKAEEKHDELLKALTATEKAVLVLLSEKQGLYSGKSKEFLEKHGAHTTRSRIQSAEKSLKKKRIITILPNRKVIVEIIGLVDAIKSQYK